MASLKAFRHRQTGDVQVSRAHKAYADREEWEPVPMPKPVRHSADDKRRHKVAGMSPVDRYDALMAEITKLRERLDKAGL